MSEDDQRQAVAIASDHAGFALKESLGRLLRELGHRVLDLGTGDSESVDYPTYGEAMAAAILDRRADRGVVVCGTGIGIAMAANRHPGVRAVVCHNAMTARLGRQHNDGNVLALGARVVDEATAAACLRIFLRTPFEGGRHARRVAMLDAPTRDERQERTGAS